MKYVWRVLVIVLCALVVLGFAVMSRLLPAKQNSMFFELYPEMKLVQENTFEMSKVHRISIDYGAEDIEIYPSDSTDLKIREYMNYEPSEGEMTTLWRTGDTLEITEGDRDGVIFFAFGTQKKIEIYIPQEYQDALAIELGSGKVEVAMDMTLSEFELNVQSGAAVLGKIEAEALDIDLSSGHIRADELKGKQDVEVSSGKADLGLVAGEGRYHCSSGQIEMKVSELVGNMDVNVSSGQIDIALPKEAEFLYQADVKTGDVDTYFEATSRGDEYEASVGNDPSKQIKVNVSSGGVNIEQY